MTRLPAPAVAWLILLVSATCGAPSSPAPPPPTVTLEVAPHTVACLGESVRRCMVVRTLPDTAWTRFYDAIEGFAFEEGYRYRIEVYRDPVPDPPADASSFRYRLARIVSREKAP